MTFYNALLLQIVEKSFEMLQDDLLTLVQMKFFIYLLWKIALCITKKSVILLSWNWTGAELLNICIIRLYLYQPKFLEIIFCYCSYRGLYNLSEEYSIWIFPSSAGLSSSGYSSVFWSFCSWRSCRRGSGDTVMVDAETHVEVFLNLFVRFAYVIDEAFFWFWDYSSWVPYYQDFQIIKCQIIGILVYL
jgi:hypothetical protein